MIYKLGFNRNFNTFSIICLMNIVLYGKFPRTPFITHKCSGMKLQVCFGDFLASMKPAAYVEVDDYKHADKVLLLYL